jgi:orotate phosphoribosyltransferase-like protein
MSNQNGKQAKAWEMFQNGMTRADIAAKLNIATCTVSNHINRAKKKDKKEKRAPIDDIHGHASPLTTVQYKRNEETGEYYVANEWRRITPEYNAIAQVVEQLAASVEGVAKVKKRKQV